MVYSLSSSWNFVSCSSLFQGWDLGVPICQIILFRLSNRVNRAHAQVLDVELGPRASNLCSHFSNRYFFIKYSTIMLFFVWLGCYFVGENGLLRLSAIMVQSVVLISTLLILPTTWCLAWWEKSVVLVFVLWGTCESECKVMYLVMFLRCFLEDGCTVTQPAATCLKLQRFQELLVVWFSHMIWEASLWEMQPYHLLPKLVLWHLPLQMLLLSSKERYVPSWC